MTIFTSRHNKSVGKIVSASDNDFRVEYVRMQICYHSRILFVQLPRRSPGGAAGVPGVVEVGPPLPLVSWQ